MLTHGLDSANRLACKPHKSGGIEGSSRQRLRRTSTVHSII